MPHAKYQNSGPPVAEKKIVNDFTCMPLGCHSNPISARNKILSKNQQNAENIPKHGFPVFPFCI